MGGHTTIKLKTTTASNIAKCNEGLRKAGVAKKYGFYSEEDRVKDWEDFRDYPHLYSEFFRSLPIRSYEDFKRHWTAEVIGEAFAPSIGTLVIDCYFGRASQRAMTNLVKWVVTNADKIKSVSGSFGTLVEKSENKDIDLIDHYTWYKNYQSS